MNGFQAGLFTSLVNNDPEMQADTARGTACMVQLLFASPGSEEHTLLHAEIDQLKIVTKRRVEDHERTAYAATKPL